MNSYITLDSHKYVTPAGWTPIINKPGTIRHTLGGYTDATYGPTDIREWQGFIRAAATPASGYGSPADLRTSLAKRTALSFTDHYGTTLNVHAAGVFKEKSFTNMWDGGSNVIDFPVRLIEAK